MQKIAKSFLQRTERERRMRAVLRAPYPRHYFLMNQSEYSGERGTAHDRILSLKFVAKALSTRFPDEGMSSDPACRHILGQSVAFSVLVPPESSTRPLPCSRGSGRRDLNVGTGTNNKASVLQS